MSSFEIYLQRNKTRSIVSLTNERVSSFLRVCVSLSLRLTAYKRHKFSKREREKCPSSRRVERARHIILEYYTLQLSQFPSFFFSPRATSVLFIIIYTRSPNITDGILSALYKRNALFLPVISPYPSIALSNIILIFLIASSS